MTAVASVPAVTPTGSGRPVSDDELGGKGATLARLARQGFPVPPAACVTASAYRAVAADPAVEHLLERIRGGAVVPAGAVDAAFLAAPVPKAIRESIVAVADRIGDGGPVAIRSSATVEDLAVASFAGQYRSSLDVRGGEAVLRAVRLTWASLWHPAPCAYRRTWGIADGDIAMAVVVMRMVAARLAGVAFTVDPGGAADRIRVEAVPGLAESLVSGERTPDVWLVPRTGNGVAAPAPVLGAATLAMRVERASAAP
ncbi:MAG TPA: PEP/pyruvate-binding domain-containing protein, partial [Pseudonocardiaceae bacterium]|nr:PEP/pyruvate-binding domain-containing protein [Pseudonocardiaceae bacterium]